MRVTGPVDTLTRATLKIIASANGCTDTPRPPWCRARSRISSCKQPVTRRTCWVIPYIGVMTWNPVGSRRRDGSRRPSPAPAASTSPPAVVRSGSSVRAGAVEACSRPAPPGWPRDASNAARAAPHRRAGSVAGQLGKHRGATKRSGAAADTRRLRDTGRPDRPRGTPATTGGCKHRGGHLAAVLVAGGGRGRA
jgi:hypothetical protein